MTKQDETSGGVGATLTDAYDKVSDTVATAYAAAREKASGAAQGTVSSIDTSPGLALAGGLAIGAIIGALVPRSDREQSLLAPLGGRLIDAARAALDAGRAAGTEALGEAGLNEDNLRAQGSKLFEQLGKAAGAAGTAAVSAARDGGSAR